MRFATFTRWVRAIINRVAGAESSTHRFGNKVIACSPGFRRASTPATPMLRMADLEERITPDATPYNLAVSNFYQNWNDASLISANDNWSGVPSVVGYLGDDTFGEGVDPQTILTPYSTVDVIANQGSNTALTAGGVAEFNGLGVVAIQADGTADAPNLVISINTSGRSNISISYSLRDIDGTTDNAVTPVALQYRIGSAGDFINVPAGFVADATTGPNIANKVTPVSVILPTAVDNQPLVQLRIITTNALGSDEWVGIDDLVVRGEFQVNTFTTSFQTNPSVAMDANGNAIVVWQSPGQEGPSYGVYGQRYNSAGGKVGEEFRINTFTTSQQTLPSAAMNAEGKFVVVWQSLDQDGSVNGIFGQRFDSAGAKLGSEFSVNSHTTGNQTEPRVAMEADGDFVVVWASLGQDGNNDGIFGQRFNSNGTKNGGEFQINTYSTNYQSDASIAIDADGDFMVAWCSYQDGFADGIYGQRFDSSGSKVGSETPINTFTSGYQRYPKVAMDADGDTVVIWMSQGADGSNYGVFGQRYNPAGSKVGSEFQTNTYTSFNQFQPAVAIDADGDAVVVWTTNFQDGNGNGIFGQRFNSAGAKVGVEFPINTFTTGHQGLPAVAVDSDGDTMVVWTSPGQDGSSDGVFGQRFRSLNPPVKFSTIQVNDGSAQRSMVKSLQITFDSSASFVGSKEAAFKLVNQESSDSVTLSAAIDISGRIVTLTFTGGSVDLGGSLSDGLYTLTILGNQFTGNGFDGNGDGITGDNYVLVGTAANGLYRLFGDGDGDAVVTSDDFALLRSTFGTGMNPAFDFNNNLTIDSDDFAEFRKRFGISFLP